MQKIKKIFFIILRFNKQNTINLLIFYKKVSKYYL